jgi:hypothetical protein
VDLEGRQERGPALDLDEGVLADAALREARGAGRVLECLRSPLEEAGTMGQTVRAVFDGEVLRPEQPLDLERNTTYMVTIEREAPREADAEAEVYPLTAIGRLATDMGVADLAAHHDRYAHGRLADE